MIKTGVKISVRPRKTGIVLLGDANKVNETVTEVAMRQRLLTDTNLKTVAGIRPFAGIRLDMEADFTQRVVVGKLTFSKEGRPLWTAHDPKIAVHGLYFYPGLAIKLAKHAPLEGRWQLTFSVAVIGRTRFESELLNAILETLVFTEVDHFAWEITNALLDLLPTGERKTPIKVGAEERNQIVHLDEI